MNNKIRNALTTAKIITLTIITFGIYGAYWAMKNAYTEADIDADEIEKNADFAQRAATSALLMRRDLH